jgi:hypothetical protein
MNDSHKRNDDDHRGFSHFDASAIRINHMRSRPVGQKV